MNNTDSIENYRQVGSDYFKMQKRKSSDKYLIDFINSFNFDDYWCYKSTRHQRLVTEEEFLEFKYGNYVFFKKELYNVKNIDKWINWMKDMGGIQFLVKPTPPFNPNKVIIREEK